MTSNPPEPIRKSLLPCTPPAEWEFHTVLGARSDTEGVALFPGDAGPVVIRRQVTYGDWEPVRPGRWAQEPEAEAPAVSSVVGQATRDRIAEARSERYAVAIHDAMENDLSLVDQEPGCQALFARAAEAAVALADAELAELRRKVGASDRIRENADFHLGQEMARRQLAEKETDRLRAELRRLAAEAQQSAVGAPRSDTQTHVYLSTGCLHGQHEYCQNTEGVAGPKKPAQCKFCTTRCVCGCHAVGARQPDTETPTAVPPPALTEVGRLRAQVEALQQDAERDRGLAKVGARCMREGHQGLIESGRSVIEGWRFALSTALGLGTGAPWEAIHERVKELTAAASAVPGRSAATDTHEEA